MDNAPWQCPTANLCPSGDQQTVLIAPVNALDCVIKRRHDVVRLTKSAPSLVTIATTSINGHIDTFTTFIIERSIITRANFIDPKVQVRFSMCGEIRIGA